MSQLQIPNFSYLNTQFKLVNPKPRNSTPLVCNAPKPCKLVCNSLEFRKTVATTPAQVESWIHNVKPEPKIGFSLDVGYDKNLFATVAIAMSKECLIVQANLLEKYGISEFPKVLKKFLEKKDVTFVTYDVEGVFTQNLYLTFKKEVELKVMCVKGLKQEYGGNLEKEGKFKFNLDPDLELKVVSFNGMDEELSNYLRNKVQFCSQMSQFV